MIEELNKNFEIFRKTYIPKLDDENKRIEAFKDSEKSGFPNKKLEDWKFSDFSSIISNKILGLAKITKIKSLGIY